MTAATGWPGLGFDPAPGDPAGAAGLGRQLTDTARHLRETHAVLKSVQEQRGAWTGEASKAFAAKLNGLPGYLDAAQTSLGRASGVLQEWNGKLGGLQTQARDLESRAVTARTQLVGAEEDERRARANPDLGLAGQLFAQQDLPEVERRLGAARVGVEQAMATAARLRDSLEDLLRQGKTLSTEHEDEAHRTAEGIRRADDGLAPPEPAWFEQALNWVGDNLDDIGDVAGTVAGIAGALAFIPVLTPIMGPIALIAGGIALAADVADLVVNDKLTDVDALKNVALDVVGLIPGGKVATGLVDAAGAAVGASRASYHTVVGLTPMAAAGAETFGRLAPDAFVAMRQPGLVAKHLEPVVTSALNRVLPTLRNTPGLAADPAVVAKSVEVASRIRNGLDRSSHIGAPQDEDGDRGLETLRGLVGSQR